MQIFSDKRDFFPCAFQVYEFNGCTPHVFVNVGNCSMAAFAKGLFRLTGWFKETAHEQKEQNGDLDDCVVFRPTEEECAQGEDEECLESSEKLVEIPGTALFVQGLKPDINKNVLELYFEDYSRSGGGEITDILIDQTSGRSIVWFEEAASKKCFSQQIT